MLLADIRLPLGALNTRFGAHAVEEPWVVRHPLLNEVSQIIAIAQVFERLGWVLDRQLGHFWPRQTMLVQARVQLGCASFSECPA